MTTATVDNSLVLTGSLADANPGDKYSAKLKPWIDDLRPALAGWAWRKGDGPRGCMMELPIRRIVPAHSGWALVLPKPPRVTAASQVGRRERERKKIVVGHHPHGNFVFVPYMTTSASTKRYNGLQDCAIHDRKDQQQDDQHQSDDLPGSCHHVPASS